MVDTKYRLRENPLADLLLVEQELKMKTLLMNLTHTLTNSVQLVLTDTHLNFLWVSISPILIV